MPALLLPTYILSDFFFKFILLFILIMWSRVCRSSGYGLNYQFPLIVAGGIVLGPAAGAILGFVPLILVPFIRPDAQVVSIYQSAVLLTIIGAVSGFLGGFGPGLWVDFAIWSLVAFNIVRLVLLFGRLPPKNTVFFFPINVGINYYLITNYLVPIITWLGGNA
ncbi:MAG: hypothetical protein ABIG20_04715 [archaeon]